MTICDLSPQAVWQYFHQLTQIPRPSHEEEAIQQYVLTEAERLGLEAQRDSVGNIIVRKPASKGREKEAGVILQGHLDMVAQKNQNTPHNFSTDPIQTEIAGEWVTARGTTLGADNGMGVAMILAILADPNANHPPLEALFTSSEETGMYGAKGLKGGLLSGSYLINLDYEDEGKLCIGCAGGVDGSYHVPYKTEKGDFLGYKLIVRGLRGGHSGVDIDKQRGNAIKVLAQILSLANAHQIAKIQGGNLRNAIPREAEAVLALTEVEAVDLKEKLIHWQVQIMNDIAADDGQVELQLIPCGKLAMIICPEDGQRLIDTLLALPNGVERMDLNMAGLVETSTNLAAVNTDGEALHIHCLLRSSNDFQRDQLAEKMASIIRLAGGKAEYSGDYSGWLPQPQSKLVSIFSTTGKAVYGQQPEITAIHAGLECGILSTHYPDWEMIAFGPTIQSPHSPDERVEIASVARSFEWLQKALAEPF